MPYGPKVHALPMVRDWGVYPVCPVDGFGQLVLKLEDGTRARFRLTLDVMRQMKEQMPTEYHSYSHSNQSDKSSGRLHSEGMTPVEVDNV